MAVARRRGTRGNLDAHIHSNSHYKKRDLTDYLSTDYKDYCLYVIRNRACPSLIDGLKTGGRKIIYSATKIPELMNGKMVKFLSLTGRVLIETQYAHGDASLISTSFTLGEDYSNCLNVLEFEGQHGSLRAPDAQSAPRYLSLRLSKYAKIMFEDKDLWEYEKEEGQIVECSYFLPIICTLLCASGTGLAPGYRYSRSVAFNPLTVIDAEIEWLKTGKIEKTILRPYVREIKQDNFIFDSKLNRWINKSDYYLDLKNDVVKITSLPYDITFLTIENTLNQLKENGDIKDWKNYSSGDALDYRVLFNKGMLTKLNTPENIKKLEKMLKLTTIIQPDILNVIDEYGKLRYFDTPIKLLEHFMKFRLAKYSDRKTRLVDVLQARFENNNSICKFIELVNNGKIKIQNRKKADIKKELKNYELPDSVLSIEISKLTDEEKAQLLKKNEEIKKELEYIKNTSTTDMFLKDLKDLKKELSSDFQ